MLVRCPKCLSAARIVASDQWTENTRKLYCQCKNINCSVTFAASLSLDHVIRSPEQGSSPPDPSKQPELLKDPRQRDLLMEMLGESCHEG